MAALVPVIRSVCPACDTPFVEFKQFTVEEVAAFERVKPSTVQEWIRSGLLKFSVVRRGRSYARRVITVAQYLEFHRQRVRLPGDGSPAALIWDEYHARKVRAGKLGGRAAALKRQQAKVAAQGAVLSEPSSDPIK